MRHQDILKQKLVVSATKLAETVHEEYFRYGSVFQKDSDPKIYNQITTKVVHHPQNLPSPFISHPLQDLGEQEKIQQKSFFCCLALSTGVQISLATGILLKTVF